MKARSNSRVEGLAVSQSKEPARPRSRQTTFHDAARWCPVLSPRPPRLSGEPARIEWRYERFSHIVHPPRPRPHPRSRSQYVLRIGNLIATHQGDPAITFEEAVASVPADKLLGGTLQSLAPHAMGRVMDMDPCTKPGRPGIGSPTQEPRSVPSGQWTATASLSKRSSCAPPLRISLTATTSRSGATAWLNYTTPTHGLGQRLPRRRRHLDLRPSPWPAAPANPAPQTRSNGKDPVVGALVQVTMRRHLPVSGQATICAVKSRSLSIARTAVAA